MLDSVLYVEILNKYTSGPFSLSPTPPKFYSFTGWFRVSCCLQWPFVRVLGIQEPSSALFSVLNGVANAYGYVSFRRRCPHTYPYRGAIAAQCLVRLPYTVERLPLMIPCHGDVFFFFFLSKKKKKVSLHTWFWSTVFHCRDTYWTERLDYFCASAMIISGLVLQFIRWEWSCGHMSGVWSCGHMSGVWSCGHMSGVWSCGHMSGVWSCGHMSGVWSCGHMSSVWSCGHMSGVWSCGHMSGVWSCGHMSSVWSCGHMSGVWSCGHMSGVWSCGHMSSVWSCGHMSGVWSCGHMSGVWSCGHMSSVWSCGHMSGVWSCGHMSSVWSCGHMSSVWSCVT